MYTGDLDQSKVIVTLWSERSNATWIVPQTLSRNPGGLTALAVTVVVPDVMWVTMLNGKRRVLESVVTIRSCGDKQCLSLVSSI